MVPKYTMSFFTPTSKCTMILDSLVFLTQSGPLKEISELKVKFFLLPFFFLNDIRDGARGCLSC